MSVVVYADFSCPDCYLAAQRAAVLAAGGVQVDWRSIEHEPALPIAGRRRTPDDGDDVAARLDALRGTLIEGEVLPRSAPAFVPRTEAAVSAYAEAYDAGVADDVRRLLFELYWQEGADIGNPAVLRAPLTGPMLRGITDALPLRESGFAVSVDRGPVTTGAHRRIRAWRTEWRDLGAPPLPVLLVDGALLSGLEAVRRLGKEIVYGRVPVSPVLADPRRYPVVSHRPPLSWVSAVGGRWRFAYRGKC